MVPLYVTAAPLPSLTPPYALHSEVHLDSASTASTPPLRLYSTITSRSQNRPDDPGAVFIRSTVNSTP
jgi:hypothetical protein